MLDMNRYQVLASRTMNHELDDGDTTLHALFGMASQIGQLQGIYQKAYQGHEIHEEHLKKQLGDLLWFVAQYCTANGWYIEDIANMNIDKLKARYPEGFSADHSLHRKENDI